MHDFLLGDITVRPELNEIVSGQVRERLPAKFINVLLVLAERPGSVWSKNELLERVWGDPLIGDEALSHAVWVLRKALGDDAKRPRFIETIPRRGYRLLPTPQAVPPAEPPREPDQPAATTQAADTTAVPLESAADARAAAENPIEINTPLPIPRRYRWRTAAFAACAMFALIAVAFEFAEHAASAPTLPAAQIFRTGAAISSLTGQADNGALVGSEDGFLYAADDAARERWRMPLGSRWTSAPAIAAGALYVGSGDGFVYALQTPGGREAWRHRIGRSVRATPLALDDRVIVGDTEGEVAALSRLDGSTLWRTKFRADVVGALRASAGHVLLTIEDGSVIALDPANGRNIWQRRFQGPLSNMAAIGDNAIVLSSDIGFVLALDARDGATLWQTELAGAGTAPLYRDGRVYAVGRYGNAAAFDAHDGQLLWQQDFDAGDRLDPTIWSGLMVVGLSEQRLGMLDLQSGQSMHTVHLPAAPSLLSSSASKLWIATADSRAYVLDGSVLSSASKALTLAPNGDMQQRAEAEPDEALVERMHEDAKLPARAWTARVIGNAQDATATREGMAYIGDERGVSAIDARGHTRWRFALSQPIGSAVVVADGRLLFGGRDRRVYALDAAHGAPLWQFATAADVIATPVVAGKMVFVGSADHSMYALHLDNGALLWSFKTQGPIHAAAAIEDGLLVFGSGDSHVYALNASDGRERWRIKAQDWVVAQPVIAQSRVFFGVANGDFHALAIATGSELWRFHSAGKIWFAPAVANGLVYFGSADGHVYALAQSDGIERWRYRTGAAAEGSVVFGDGVLYAGSHDASLYALDADNGAPLWRLRTGGSVWNPALLGNSLLVPSADQHVYALQL